MRQRGSPRHCDPGVCQTSAFGFVGRRATRSRQAQPGSGGDGLRRQTCGRSGTRDLQPNGTQTTRLHCDARRRVSGNVGGRRRRVVGRLAPSRGVGAAGTPATPATPAGASAATAPAGVSAPPPPLAYPPPPPATVPRLVVPGRRAAGAAGAAPDPRRADAADDEKGPRLGDHVRHARLPLAGRHVGGPRAGPALQRRQFGQPLSRAAEPRPRGQPGLRDPGLSARCGGRAAGPPSPGAYRDRRRDRSGSCAPLSGGTCGPPWA